MEHSFVVAIHRKILCHYSSSIVGKQDSPLIKNDATLKDQKITISVGSKRLSSENETDNKKKPAGFTLKVCLNIWFNRSVSSTELYIFLRECFIPEPFLQFPVTLFFYAIRVELAVFRCFYFGKGYDWPKVTKFYLKAWKHLSFR